MDRSDVGGVVVGAIPLAAGMVAEGIIGKPMDAVINSPWGPAILLIVGIPVAWLYYRLRGPSREDYQKALDKMIDTTYVLPHAAKPQEGISTEGVVQEHAPHNFRRDWYLKLGLPEPKRHMSKYR
jgi:hypothetical protein